MAGDPLFDALAQFPKPPAAPDPIYWHDFQALKIPPRELMMPPWLPTKGIAMIAAPRGVGKTYVALNIAYAVATGGTFLGWKATAPRRVLYIDGEMPAVSLQQRLEGIATHAQSQPARDAFALMASDLADLGLPDFSTPEGQAAVRPKLAPFDLIVMDNLSTLCRTGRENEAESWVLVQEFVLELRRAGKSVLFVHHTGKNGAQRGTSKREDVLDAVLLLERPEGYDASEGLRIVVRFDKARGFFGPDAEPFEASLDAVTGLWTMKRITTKRDNRDAEVLEMHTAGKTQRAIADALGIGVGTVNRTLERLNGRENSTAI